MAVNVRIPGVGVVSADNAATESTLRALLQAMTAQQGRSRRADSELAQASKQQAGYADRAADSLSQVASSAKSSESASRSLFSNLSEGITKATLVAGDIKDTGVATYLKQLGATAVEVSTLWAKNFGEIRENPIKAASNLLATGIDAVVTGTKTSFQALLPDEFKKLTDAAGKIVGAGLQTANTMLYNEVNQTMKAVATFNKMGASFVDGISGMRTAAFQSGLTVDQFAAAMEKAQPSLKLMGLTTAGAAEKVSGIAYEFGKVRADGTSLRNELRGLGYTTEEQAELAAQYLANLRGNMTAEKFRDLDRSKVAQETRQYAEDLKVLADITGKNAKQAMEEARAKAMEADIMARLGSEEEIKKFQAAYANMPDYAKKGFLEYVSSGGQAIVDQATNIAMAQNAEIKPMYEQAYANIYDVGKNATNVQNELLTQASRAGEEQRRITKEAGGNIIGMAARFGASGLDQLAGFFNSMVSTGLYTPKAVEDSRTNAQNMAKLNDDMLKNMVKFQDSMQNYAVSISQALGPAIKVYTDALATVANAMNNFVLINLRGLTGKAPPKDASGKYKEGEAPTEPYTAAQYRADLQVWFGTYMEKLLGVLQKVPGLEPRRMATGGLVRSPTFAIVGEAGPEAVIPLESGKVPVQISGASTGIAEISNSVQQLHSTFSAILSAAKNSNNQPTLAKEEVRDLPAALSTALETVLSSPTGLVQTMTQVKTQIADDNKMQMAMMQQQIDNLTRLVDAMNDNVKYSERLANELT